MKLPADAESPALRDVTGFYAITTAVNPGAVMIALAWRSSPATILKPCSTITQVAATSRRALPTLRAAPQDEIGKLTQTFCEMVAELVHKRNQEHLQIKKLINAQ